MEGKRLEAGQQGLLDTGAGKVGQRALNVEGVESAPGADDDGSGSMSILEAYRALIAAGFHPERAVEFHWYSAEVRPSSVAQKLNLQEDVP